MHQDEDLHSELMAAFRVYFEANQRWMSTSTKRAAIDVRNAMSKIRDICNARRKVVRLWQDEKEEQLRILEAERQAKKKAIQNQQAQQGGSDI